MQENIINTNRDDFNDKLISFKDFPMYDHNPFIEPILSIKTRKKTVSITTNPKMVIGENGQYLGDSYMVVRKNVDKEEFVKIFKDQLRIIFELSKKSQKLLSYFAENLNMNNDYILFDRKKAKLNSGISSDRSIYLALSELIQKGIIAKSTSSFVYYINPAILFNGDRLVVVNAWIKDNKIIPVPNPLIELQEKLSSKELTK
jgi:hypothetical protein